MKVLSEFYLGLSDIINTYYLSKQFVIWIISKSRNSYAIPWGFLVVLAIKPILLSALPVEYTSAPFAAITSWCSFRQTNVFFGRETCPVHQVLGMIRTLTNSSKVKLQLHSCKISHRCNQRNNGRTSAALKTLPLQVPADGPNRCLSTEEQQHTHTLALHFQDTRFPWGSLAIALRLVSACAGTADHASGSIYSFKKPQI